MYVLRLLEVLAVLLGIPILKARPLIAPPRARGRRPRRAVEERSAKNEIYLMRDARFVVSTNRASIYPRIKTVRNCPHAGRAVPRALRQRGITPNSCKTKVYVLRLLEVLAVLSGIPILKARPLLAPPRARGRRPRRAVEERSAKNEIC